MFYCTKLGSDGAGDPLGVCLPLGDRVHIRKLQAIPGTGRPGQSPPQGGRADGADGLVHRHDRGGVVPPDGPSIRGVPLAALVSEEGGTVVRRHVDDPETAELRGENRGIARETDPTENLDRPAHRASQPDGVRSASARDSRVTHRVTNEPTGQFRLPGRSPYAFRSAKQELRIVSSSTGAGPRDRSNPHPAARGKEGSGTEAVVKSRLSIAKNVGLPGTPKPCRVAVRKGVGELKVRTPPAKGDLRVRV